MFEKLIKELNRLNNMKVEVPLESDQEGYRDHQCPNEACEYVFKCQEDDWANLFKDEAVFCPRCGHNAPSDSWFTLEQIEKARSQATEHIHAVVKNAMHADARSFNRRQTNKGFITMSLSVSGSPSAINYIVPVEAREVFEKKIQCNECHARYAVIGSAFFCPCCGKDSADTAFDEAMKSIRLQMDSVGSIIQAVEPVLGKDGAADNAREMIESKLCECVSAFQRFCDVTFHTHFPGVRVKFNSFQKLDAGSQYWKDAIGKGYEDALMEKERDQLTVSFQRRHILQHNNGVVDQKYIDRSGDTSYIVGQRVVITPEEVKRVTDQLQILVAMVRSNLS